MKEQKQEQQQKQPHRGDDGKLYLNGEWVELYEGEYRAVLQPEHSGWWRFHEHYDRNGYCDNPARGY